MGIIVELENKEQIVIDLSKMKKRELKLSLEYFFFALETVPNFSANIFLEKANLFNEADFLEIIEKVKNSEIAKKEPKKLLAFLRKIFIAMFNNLRFKPKLLFVYLHLKLLSSSELQKIVDEEYEEWPPAIQNFYKFICSTIL